MAEYFYTLNDGTEMCYEDVGGSGRPVIFIHGISGCKQDMCDCFKTPVADAGFRFIAMDMRGTKPTKPSRRRPVTMDMLAGDIHDFLIGMDLKDVTLVGHSMGGQDIQKYVKIFGNDRLHSIILIDIIPLQIIAPDWDHACNGNTYTFEQGIANAKAFKADPVGYWKGFALATSPDFTEAEAQAYAEKALSNQYVEEMGDMYYTNVNADARGFEGSLKVPMAYIYASKGVLCDPGVVDYYREKIADFTAYPFESSNHFFLYEPQHVPAVAQAIVEFIKR